MVTFPTLPRFVMPPSELDDADDEEMRMARYYSMRAGYNITSVMNDPRSRQSNPPPLVIPEIPELTDSAIDVPALREFARQTRRISRRAGGTFRPQMSRNHLMQGFYNHENEVVAAAELMREQFMARPSDADPSAGDWLSRESIELAERQAEQELVACLRVVPHEYFEPAFHAKFAQHFSELADRQDSTIVQEKLSHYLDVIEVNLLKQISARAHSFFTALVTIQDLYEEVRQGCDTIKAIRAQIAAVEAQLVDSSLSVLRRKRRVQNAARVLELMKRIADVVAAQSHVVELIDSGSYSPALRLINATRYVLRTRLVGVACLKFYDVKLDQRTILVERLVGEEFVRIAVSGLHRATSAETLKDPVLLEADGKPIFPASVLTLEEIEQINQLVSDLSSIGKLATLMAPYRQLLNACLGARLQAIVAWQLGERHAPLSPTATNGDSASIVRSLQSLPHDVFLRLLRFLYHGMAVTVERVANVRDVAVRAATQFVADKQRSRSSTSIKDGASADGDPVDGVLFDQQELSVLRSQFKRDFQDLVASMCESVHSRCARIIGTRATLHANLKLAELREFFDLSLAFVAHGEALCGKTLYTLRGTLLSQARDFLEQMHSSNMTALAKHLESENWRRINVAREYQILIDRGLESKDRRRPAAGLIAPIRTNLLRGQEGDSQPPSPYTPQSPAPDGSKRRRSLSRRASGPPTDFVVWDQLLHRSPFLPVPERAAAPTSTSASATEDSGPGDDEEDSKASRVLFVEDATPSEDKRKKFFKFPVVKTVLHLLDMVVMYLECSSQLQAAESEILHKLVELLKLFNSRTCQLVLGAGAMHLAGLKSITAKHLALSYQCLGLIASQVPVMRKAFAVRLPSKHHVLLSEFDQVTRDFEEHQQEILSKLVKIVSDISEATCKQLLTSPWAKAESAGGGDGSASASASASAAAGGGDDAAPRRAKPKLDKPIRTLMKQVASLHRVLSDLLPPKVRNDVFERVASVFSTVICKYMSRLNATSRHVQLAISVNVSHVLKRLRSLDGLGPSACSELDVFLFRDSS